ncbi:LOG family protein [Acetobacterium woodii]|nr:TIGR00730 family Rossman fold protein [Acetobacterium woodii]
MKRICVYSGSNLGIRPEYKEITKQLGTVLVQNNIELVYGGSQTGLMGEIANEMLQQNGKVTGVTPKGLFPKEVINDHLTQLIEVKNMHERKQTMADLSDGFIAIPGGIGTFEELFETYSWAQLGIHQKPIGILNISHFFDSFIALMQNIVTEGFMNPSNTQLVLVSSDPAELIEKMICYSPPVLGNKWSQLDAILKKS